MTSTLPSASSPRSDPGGWVLLILGAVLGLIGAGLVIAGSALVAANAWQSGGRFFMTPTESLSTGSYALVSPTLALAGEPGSRVELATVRLQAASLSPGTEIFIGVAPTEAVNRYLSGVHHCANHDLAYTPFAVSCSNVAGSRIPAAPRSQSFWGMSASGPGTQHVDWPIRPGTWSAVVMNADGSARVAVTLAAGARSGLLQPIAAGVLVGGIVLFLTGAALDVLGAVRLGGAMAIPARDPDAGTAPPPVARPGFPVHLIGRLDPALSRGLWLVKWLLAVPHYIVLFLLWFAFVVTTVVAGFAILFTGRYPRSLFAFNVGVLRWSWRVGFYAYAALGTDRYPPFSLDHADYPADLDVEYPERLSHGLVLVKSWLLAIPHLLIVSVLTGGDWWWPGSWWPGVFGPGRWIDGSHAGGLSLLGILVLVAGVMLLFTGRYQAPLFDVVMGINRWLYRVIGYVALMRDDYPPFRLDQGPGDERPEPHPPGR